MALGGCRAEAGEEPKASLDPLSPLLKADLDSVNSSSSSACRARWRSSRSSPATSSPAGGKRLRPMLTLGGARMCGYRGDRHVALAAAVEFIHTATLLHDDVVDASDLRRGRDTANAVWGNKPAVLVGDFLFSRSFELMVADGSLRVLEILSRASAVIAEGEVLQLITSNDTATTEGDYLAVIQSKTAELFAAASRIGAVLAERPREEEALEAFGRNLGIAFQLVDDMLDYSAREASSARASATISAMARSRCRSCSPLPAATRRSAAFWRRTIEELEQQPGDLERAIDLVERRGALAETLARARTYAAAATAPSPRSPTARSAAP